MGVVPQSQSLNFELIFRPWGFLTALMTNLQLKPDPTTFSGRFAPGSSGIFYFRYFVWEKLKFGIKMLAETS